MPTSTDQVMQRAVQRAGMSKVPPDSRIYRPAEGVERVLAVIDAPCDELAAARAAGFDLVLAHHPPDLFVGEDFLRVMDRHVDLMTTAGVPPDKAARARDEARSVFVRGRGARGRGAASHEAIARVAEEAGIGLMNVHQPCDEVGRRILQATADALDPKATAADLVEAFGSLPEIAWAEERPRIVCGRPDAPLGRTLVVHAAGTNGGYAVAAALFEAGVGTVVYIHLDPAEGERLRAEGRGTVIVTGHYASDSVGINPLLDDLERDGIELAVGPKLIRAQASGGGA